MIEPERILYYFENVALLLDDECFEDSCGDKEWREFHQKNVKALLKNFYMFCHIGTASMHKCQHPQWEQLFLDVEKELIDSGHMKPYAVKKQKMAVQLSH